MTPTPHEYVEAQTPAEPDAALDRILAGQEHPPTAEQRRVITSTAPAILVVAGAGSGKTKTMVDRIAYHLACGNVSPDEVLGLTFTRKAAGELAERVNTSLEKLGLLAPEGSNAGSAMRRPVISTYNSFANDIAGAYGMLVGADPTARLITDAERVQLMDQVVSALPSSASTAVLAERSRSSLINDALTFAQGILTNGVELAEARAFLTAQDHALETLCADSTRIMSARCWYPDASKKFTNLKGGAAVPKQQQVVLGLVESYLQLKKELNVTEFADQVAIAGRIMTRYPQIAKEISSRYRLILLDEYQDTDENQAQFLLGALTAKRDGFLSITAVGDPNQAIYGWRGASAAALTNFARHTTRIFGHVEKLQLSTAFRNDRAVLAAGNAVATPLERDTFLREDRDHPNFPPEFRPAPTSAGTAGSAGESTDIAPLRLRERPGAGAGRVSEIRTLLREDSYRSIARHILAVRERVAAENEERRARGEAPRGAEIAVLCRKRSYIDMMAAALRELNSQLARESAAHPGGATPQPLAFEIVGGESLVARPEIITLRAALGLAANPARGDLLARLLAHWNIGVADIRALSRWARRYAAAAVTKVDSDVRASFINDDAAPGHEGASGAAGELATAQPLLNSRDEANLGEALHALMLLVSTPSTPGMYEDGDGHLDAHADGNSGEHGGECPGERADAAELAGTGEAELRQAARSARGEFSSIGWERLRRLNATLASLRSGLHNALADQIDRAVHLLGLDTAAATRSEGGQRVRTSIDQFISLARTYAHGDSQRGIREFVEWLDVVETEEHGGEEESGADIPRVESAVDVTPGVIQLMTVHAAKGLEWRDLVVVPELVKGQFSEVTEGVKAWPRNTGIFPYPLRTDYPYLPQFTLAGARNLDKITVANTYARFLDELAYHESEEMRRLAYVAFTRSTRELLLAGYCFQDDKDVSGRVQKAEKQAKKNAAETPEDGGDNALGVETRPPSCFLSAVREAAARGELTLAASPATVSSVKLPEGFPDIAPDSLSVDELVDIFGEKVVYPPVLEPVPHYFEAPDLLAWPRDLARSLPIEAETLDADQRAELTQVIGRLIARKQQAETSEYTEAGGHYTATELVYRAEHREEYLLNKRRPVPRQPSRAARLGTILHEKIADSYASAAVLNIDSEDPLDHDPVLSAEEIARMYENYEASEWASYPPLAIEQQLGVVIGGHVVHCALDAVFDTSQVPGRAPVTIVDWKSGRRPYGETKAARELQLALYRLAWSRAHSIPLAEIDASFVYLRGNRAEELRAGKLSEEEILLRAGLPNQEQ
ncbi:UvrD-helicase domain-containing protein [Actinotignum sp. GS-2025b]|uniref:UvrD-helicase domain-containing protein n=1 Tax=Actinotignum sp. GS-2025b TaxID=3427275 RepID=UPI003F46F98E